MKDDGTNRHDVCASHFLKCSCAGLPQPQQAVSSGQELRPDACHMQCLDVLPHFVGPWEGSLQMCASKTLRNFRYSYQPASKQSTGRPASTKTCTPRVWCVSSYGFGRFTTLLYCQPSDEFQGGWNRCFASNGSTPSAFVVLLLLQILGLVEAPCVSSFLLQACLCTNPPQTVEAPGTRRRCFRGFPTLTRC